MDDLFIIMKVELYWFFPFVISTKLKVTIKLLSLFNKDLNLLTNLKKNYNILLTETLINTVFTEFHLSFLLSIIMWNPMSASSNLK